MKLNEIANGYLHQLIDLNIQQAQKESVVYEGLITSYSPYSIVSSINDDLKRVGATVGIKSSTSKFFSIAFTSPIPHDVVEKAIRAATAGGWFVATAYVTGRGIDETFKGVNEAIAYIAKSHTRLKLQLVFEAKYGINVTENITKKYTKLFHITPVTKVSKVLKYGLSPRSESKLSYHPERIYLALSQKDLTSLADHMNDLREENGDPRITFATLEVDIKALQRPGVQLLADPAFPEGVYTLSNIAPQYIKVIS